VIFMNDQGEAVIQGKQSMWNIYIEIKWIRRCMDISTN